MAKEQASYTLLRKVASWVLIATKIIKQKCIHLGYMLNSKVNRNIKKDHNKCNNAISGSWFAFLPQTKRYLNIPLLSDMGKQCRHVILARVALSGWPRRDGVPGRIRVHSGNKTKEWSLGKSRGEEVMQLRIFRNLQRLSPGSFTGY